MTHGGRLPGLDEINPYMLGEEGANCLLIAVRSPIEHSHFVKVGVNLAVLFLPHRYIGRNALVASITGGVGALRLDIRGRGDVSWLGYPPSQRIAPTVR
jgi:hypothetical protein